MSPERDVPRKGWWHARFRVDWPDRSSLEMIDRGVCEVFIVRLWTWCLDEEIEKHRER